MWVIYRSIQLASTLWFHSGVLVREPVIARFRGNALGKVDISDLLHVPCSRGKLLIRNPDFETQRVILVVHDLKFVTKVRFFRLPASGPCSDHDPPRSDYWRAFRHSEF